MHIVAAVHESVPGNIAAPDVCDGAGSRPSSYAIDPNGTGGFLTIEASGGRTGVPGDRLPRMAGRGLSVVLSAKEDSIPPPHRVPGFHLYFGPAKPEDVP
jgi:hypothetical protein